MDGSKSNEHSSQFILNRTLKKNDSQFSEGVIYEHLWEIHWLNESYSIHKLIDEPIK